MSDNFRFFAFYSKTIIDNYQILCSEVKYRAQNCAHFDFLNVLLALVEVEIFAVEYINFIREDVNNQIVSIVQADNDKSHKYLAY